MRWLFASLVLLASCAPDPVTLRADVPFESGDASALVAILRAEQPPELRAYTIEDGRLDPAWNVGVEADDSWTVQVLVYDAPLADLRLSPGVVKPTTDDVSRPLPTPDRVLTRHLAARTLDDGWSTSTPMDSALEAVRLPSLCATFDRTEVRLPTDTPAMFLVAIDDERALLGDLAGDLHLAYPDGRLQSVTSTLGLIYDAYADDAGDLFLGGEDGRVLRARLVGDALEVIDTETIGNDDILFLDGDRDPSAEVRFVLDEGLARKRDANGWTTIFTFGRPRGLLAYGDHARAVVGYNPHAWAMDPDEELEDLVTASTIAGGVTALGVTPLGVVAGTEYGQLYRRNGQDDWVFLEGLDPALLQIRGIATYEEGFVYVRPDGLLQVVGDEACPYITTVAEVGDSDDPQIGIPVEDAARTGGRAELTIVGRDIAVLGWRGPESSRRNELWWLRPR